MADLSAPDEYGFPAYCCGLDGHAPKLPAIAATESDDPGHVVDEDCPLAVDGGDDGRRIGGLITGAPPDVGAASFVEAHDPRSIGAPHCGDELIAVDQRRTIVSVTRGTGGRSRFADEYGAEVPDVIGAPDKRAIGDPSTLQLPAAGDGIDAVVIDERELTADRLASVTRDLLANRARRDAMATAMRGLAKPDAARRIVDCVLELAGVASGRAH